MALFGVIHSWWALTVVPVAVLLALAVSGPILAYSASVKSDNMFALMYRFAIIPMTLFAGVFFPVSSMPLAARWIAYLSPLWHGIELARYATLGLPSALSVWVHLGYLALWTVVGYRSGPVALRETVGRMITTLVAPRLAARTQGLARPDRRRHRPEPDRDPALRVLAGRHLRLP